MSFSDTGVKKQKRGQVWNTVVLGACPRPQFSRFNFLLFYVVLYHKIGYTLA